MKSKGLQTVLFIGPSIGILFCLLVCFLSPKGALATTCSCPNADYCQCDDDGSPIEILMLGDGDIELSVDKDISGGFDPAISITAEGSGTNTITVDAGTTLESSAYDYAIDIMSDASSGRDNAITVNGDVDGLHLYTYGSDATTNPSNSITVTGSITEVLLESGESDSVDDTITLTGSADYIWLSNTYSTSGSATITISDTGSITGDDSQGVSLGSYGSSVTNTITVDGLIDSQSLGIEVIASSGGGSNTITVNNDVAAALDTIALYSDEDESDAMVSINVSAIGSLVAGRDGIYLLNENRAGTTEISIGGSVAGDEYGINVESAGSTGSTMITLLSGGSLSGGNGTAIFNDGVEQFTVNSNGTLTGNVVLGGDDDVFILSAGTVTDGNIYMDGSADTGGAPEEADTDGADAFTVNGGDFTGTVYLCGGDDTVTFNGGSITGDIYGGSGNDTFTWSGGEFNSEFHGGDGSDTLTVSATDYDGTQVLDGGDDAGTADGAIDTLTFSGVAISTAGANLTNWETLGLVNSSVTISDGELVVGQSITLDASRLTIEGTLTLGDGSAGSGVFLNNDSVLDSVSGVTYAANLINAGSIISMDGEVNNTNHVNGDYSGDGVLVLDVDFSTATADTLVVEGNIASSGTVDVNNIQTDEADSLSDEILLIQALGDSDKSDEQFTLAEADRYNGVATLGRWSSSPFIWKLKTSGDNWVLGDAYEEDGPASDDGDDTTGVTKPVVIPEIPAEASLFTFSYEVSVNNLNTLHQRLGELRKHGAWSNVDPASGQTRAGLFPPVGFDENALNAWGRTTYAGFSIDADESFEVDGHYHMAQFGFDHMLGSEDNTIYAGFYGGFIQGKFDNSGESDDYGSLYAATTDMDGRSAGVYGTWMNGNGTYADLVLDYMSLDAEITSVEHFNTDGEIFSGSIEAGQSLAIRPRHIVEPQIQIKVAHVTWDSFNDGHNDVSFDDHTYVTGRAGVRGEYTPFRKSGLEVKPWLYLGAQHEFTDDPTITNVIDFNSHEYDTTGSFQAGITWEDTGMFQFYVNAGYTTDFDVYDAWRGDLGLRIRF